MDEGKGATAAEAGDVEALISLTERLTLLIADQAQAFEAGRPQDVAPSIEETSKLAVQYRREAQAVRENPAPVAAASAKDRMRLVRATEAFDAVIARQGRALAAARKITDGLVHAIAGEIANQRAAGATYGPKATKVRDGKPTSVTVNQRA
jgi:hypothetical protein